MKKILFVITKSNWGGAQRYVYDLATHIPQHEFDISVALGGNGALAEKLRNNGIRIIPIPLLKRDINLIREIKALIELWRIFNAERPDIIHLNSSKIGGLGGFIAFLLKLKDRKFHPLVVFTVHGWAFNEDRLCIARYTIRLLQWFTVLFCNQVIIISHKDFRQALHLPFITKQRFNYIPLGISESSLVFLPRASARAKLSKLLDASIKKETVVLGTIAELTKNKGISYLIDAVDLLRKTDNSFFSVIVGEGEDRKKLEHHITEKKLGAFIKLTGFIENASEYFKGFDIFVLPSVKEGLPYTIIEAMHAGVPVVASRVGGVRDLIEHEQNGLSIQPKNIESLARNIERLMHNHILQTMYAKASKKKIQTRFSFEDMLKKTLYLYK